MSIKITTYESEHITIKDYSGSITCIGESSGSINLATNESRIELSSPAQEVSIKQENNTMALVDMEDLTDQLKEYVKDSVINSVKEEVIAAVNDHTNAAIKEETDKLKPLIYAGL